jgi:hypothetical protein
MTRRAYRAARSGLWVTRTSVCPEEFRFTSSSPIASPVAVSRAPVGSSACRSIRSAASVAYEAGLVSPGWDVSLRRKTEVYGSARPAAAALPRK